MDMIELIKIAAIVALIMFIILALFAMVSFRSVIRLVNDSLKSFDKFKNDFNKNLNSLSENVTELKEKVVGSLDNFDVTVKNISQNSEDISALKDKVVESLTNFDKLSDSLTRNSEDISELKTKFVFSLEKVDRLSEQVVSSAKHIESNANDVLDSIKPVAGLVHLISDKVAAPVNFTASLISASSKAVKTFINFAGGKETNTEKLKKQAKRAKYKDEREEDIADTVEFVGSPDLYHTSESLMSDEEFYSFKEKIQYDDSSRASDSFTVTEISEPDYLKFADDEGALEIIDSANEELESILSDAEREILENDNLIQEEKDLLKKKIEDLRRDARESANNFKEQNKL